VLLIAHQTSVSEMPALRVRRDKAALVRASDLPARTQTGAAGSTQKAALQARNLFQKIFSQ
jgi:hypothetical protein